MRGWHGEVPAEGAEPALTQQVPWTLRVRGLEAAGRAGAGHTGPGVKVKTLTFTVTQQGAPWYVFQMNEARRRDCKGVSRVALPVGTAREP